MSVVQAQVLIVFVLSLSVFTKAQSCPGVDHDDLSLSMEDVKQELARFEADFGFERPHRSTVDPSRSWLRGTPSYERADLEYFRGRSRNHSRDSAEYAVENFVKQWEMEVSHLAYNDWTTVSQPEYKISVNGAPPVQGMKAAAGGNYNTLLASLDSELYDASNHTFETSQTLFTTAFPDGFPWELVKVLSGPPLVVFSWRHWARFSGTYRGRDGDDKTYELYGISVVTLNDLGKILNVAVYFRPEEFLRALQGELEPDVLRQGATIFGSGLSIAAYAAPKSCPGMV